MSGKAVREANDLKNSLRSLRSFAANDSATTSLMHADERLDRMIAGRHRMK